MLPRPLQDLIEELNKLPGIGPRSAERLAMAILRRGRPEAELLATVLGNLHAGIRECARCHNLSAQELCLICQNSRRDQAIIAIVEDALDVAALERSGSYRGLYHVLGGIISPLDGIGPEQLNLGSLRTRVKGGGVEELILATNPSIEGEATAHYIRQMLPEAIITRLARGLPMGSDLEYADQITLTRALEGRQTL